MQSARAEETRRGFVRFLVLAATGTAATALSACTAGGAEPRRSAQQAPGEVETPEIVALRPGVTYENVLPTSVPLVRQLKTAGSMYAQQAQ
jgi:hypothetical protein